MTEPLRSLKTDPIDPKATEASLMRAVRGPLIVGLSVIAVFFGVGGAWSALAPLSGAAIAPGIVAPESSRRTVQHLEGGIIQELRVGEGQRVDVGDVLVVLEDANAKAEAGARLSTLLSLVAVQARLTAERDDAEAVVFDDPILANSQSTHVRATIQAQLNQFQTRRENDLNRASILRQRIIQLSKQSEGLRRQLAGVREQQALIIQEVSGVQTLLDKGLASRPRLLGLQRTQAQLNASEGELEASIARIDAAIAETRLQVQNLRSERREEIDAQLTEVLAQRVALEEEIRGIQDRLRRTEIRAPISGTVIDLQYKTIGGVIGPGERIVDLVPLEDDLVIEARVSTNDVDEVHAGQTAHVVFSSFSQRNLPRIEGSIRWVSPDALEDARTGEHYFSAHVTVDREQLDEVGPGLVLSPGMPADVFIATGERTALDFLLRPFRRTLERGFRES